MADVSPPKWHLAHTAWFFETFLLKPFAEGYRPFNDHFEHLFNSYYNGVGYPWPRARRGILSRPTVREVLDYRHHVNEAMAALLRRDDGEIAARVELGLQHEQQHQELLLTDIKYILGTNPLLPPYREDLEDRRALRDGPAHEGAGRSFSVFEGGIVRIGAPAAVEPSMASDGFCFDNEQPRHQALLAPFALADDLVTNAEFLSFVEDGGYRRPELWLSDGWSAVAGSSEAGAAGPAPLYWSRRAGQWYEYRLSGPAPLDPQAPVVHVSFYEADAFARWAGCRLPTEHEWEHVATGRPVAGNFADSAALHPLPRQLAQHASARPRQLFGDLWEWTASPYTPYPGYRPLPGTLGEYNGKFMSNQQVLRGGSCVTPAGHVRPTYRNFFHPGDKWQFTGIRLARDV